MKGDIITLQILFSFGDSVWKPHWDRIMSQGITMAREPTC